MHKTFRIVPGACLVNVLSSLKAHVVLSCFFFFKFTSGSTPLCCCAQAFSGFGVERAPLCCSARLVLVGPSLLVERGL